MSQTVIRGGSYLWIRRLTRSSLLLAMALVLPFFTGQLREIGKMLCPMHIPILLCGYLCGWGWGLATGLLAPLLRSLLFSMPPMANAFPMAVELAAYGLMTGLLHRRLPKKPGLIYVSLLTAMVTGRVIWGLVQFALSGLRGTTFTMELFLAGSVTNAIPGIALQLVLVPILVMVLEGRRSGS